MAVRKVAEAHGHGEGYCAEYRDEDGKRRHRHFRRKKDAEEAVNRGKVNRQRSRAGLPVERASIKYGEYVQRFLDGHDVSANTMRVLRDRLNVTVRIFGDVPLGDLRSEVIRSLIATLPKSGARRKGDVLRAMRMVLSRAVEDGYLQRNPARQQAAPVPRVDPTDVRPLRSWAEVYRLASAVVPRDSAIIIVACGTGIRPEEWIGLEWGDVDLSARTLTVRRTVVRGVVRDKGKTHGSLRVVQLQRKVVEALDAWQLASSPQSESELVFPSNGGGYIYLDRWRVSVWKPALERVGLEHRPLYQMRHTFASLALAAGVPLEWISVQLGHSSYALTLRVYSRFLKPSHERALALLDAD